MIEPISPEAYLAIASAAKNTVTRYKDNRHAKRSAKLANASSQNSSNETSLSSGSLDDLLAQEGLQLDEDGYVQFSPDSPTHPRAWSQARKVYNMILIMFLNFFMSAMSNAGTPVASYAMETFGVSRVIALLEFTTTYLIGLAIGHLLFSPYADSFGRKTLYVASAFLFSVFCIPVAATPHIAAVFVGRFVTGFVSAIPRITVISSIDDLFGKSQGRSWAFFASSLTSNIGLIIGPIFASQIAVALNWRWPFYISTIIFSVLSLLFLTTNESSSINLLNGKIALLRSSRPDIEHHAAPRPLSPSPYQPLVLLFTSPFVLLTTLISALILSILYILPLILPLIYTSNAYKLTSQTSISLFSLAIIGLLFTVLPRYWNHLNPSSGQRSFSSGQRLVNKYGPLTYVVGALALPIALWWFAWTIPPHTTGTPWVASGLSLILLGWAIGEITIFLLQSLILFSPAAADKRSVLTATAFWQAILGGGGVLVTEVMYKNLNTNIATSVLAAIATVMGLCILVLVYGTTHRRDPRGAAGEEAGQRGLLEEKQKKKERKERQKRERAESGEGEYTSVTAAGAMGLDLERLAIFPYFF